MQFALFYSLNPIYYTGLSFQGVDQKLSFGIGDHIGTVHLHEGRFDEEPGLAAAAATDDQDVFVPGVLGIFRSAGHGELFRLGQREVPVRDRIDIRGNIRRRAP